MTENPAPTEAEPRTASASAVVVPAQPAGPDVPTVRPDRGRDATDRAGEAMERAGDAMERAGEAMVRGAAASGRIASAVVDRLRNDAEFTADRGTTRIEDEVVEKVAGIAARQVPGVHDLGGDTARFFASVKERVGLGEAESGNRGVSVRLDGTTARITVTVEVEYGVQVYPVTEAVRTEVIKQVEGMLALTVAEVNIVVDDVHVPGSRSSSAG
jgi:uncharacterized alkaline shock family protein YloU